MFFLVIRNFSRRKVRSTLTVLGVSSMIALTLLMLGVASSIQETVLGPFERAGIDLNVVQKGTNSALFSMLEEEIAERIAELDGVSFAGPVLIQTIRIGTTTTVVEGVVSSKYVQAFNVKVSKGRYIRDDERGVVALGEVVAKSLGLGVGDHVEIGGSSLEVVGIVSTGSVQDFDVHMPIKEAQRIFRREGKVSSVGVKLNSREKVEEFKKVVESKFPDVTVYKWSEYVDFLREPIEVGKANISLISVIAVATSTLGVMNVLFTSVFERTREIGILKAIGMTPKTILRLVLSEAVLIGLFGAAIGITAGSLASRLFVLPNFFGAPIRISTSPYDIILVLAISVTTSILGGLYPAWRASRMSVVEALRFV